MQLGMIGLGRMGGNMIRRVMGAGHEGVVHDLDRGSVDRLVGEGAVGTHSLEELVERLRIPGRGAGPSRRPLKKPSRPR